jgi:hypothetical protein
MDPGGMMMDLVRFPYRRQAIFGQDGTLKEHILWRPCQPDALWFPHPHNFGSWMWQDRRGTHWPNIGECAYHKRFNTWDDSGPPGVAFVGDPQWFLTGIPPGQQPLSCADGSVMWGGAAIMGGPALLAPGGLEWGGAAVVLNQPAHLSRGGLSWDGSARLVVPFQYTGRGGLEWEGQAHPSFPVTVPGARGIEWGGRAVVNVPLQYASRGGVRWGGSAAVATSWHYTGRGGLEWEGQAHPLLS